MARSARPRLLLHQAVKDFQQGIDDGLAKGVGRRSDFVFAMIPRGDGEIAAFFGDDRTPLKTSPFSANRDSIRHARFGGSR